MNLLRPAHFLAWTLRTLRSLRCRLPLFLVLLASLSWPATAGLVLVGETVHRSKGAPGGAVTGTITVLNRGTEPAQVRLYQTDYRFQAAEGSEFPDPGSLPRSNARWLTLDRNQLSIAPGGTAEVNYRGTVPADGALVGTYWSLIMVEQTEQIQAPSKAAAPGERQAAIRTVVRHAVQVALDLGTPTAPALEVRKRSIDSDSRGKMFLLDVENTGRWMVRPEVDLELFDAGGVAVAKVSGARVRLYPNCSFRYRFDLAGVSAGKYTALVVLDTGDDNPSAAQYTLEVP